MARASCWARRCSATCALVISRRRHFAASFYSALATAALSSRRRGVVVVFNSLEPIPRQTGSRSSSGVAGRHDGERASPIADTMARICDDSTTRSHYEGHSTESYESAYFYETGAYTERLCELVRDRLRLEESDVKQCRDDEKDDEGGNGRKRRLLLDIGGGTGSFTRMIVKGTPVRAIVVDPFLEHSTTTNTATANEGEREYQSEQQQVDFVKASAEDFIDRVGGGDDDDDDENQDETWCRRQHFHQVMLKEVAHHFADEDRVGIFEGLYRGLIRLPPGTPSILIVTRPQRDIDYPLWDAARDVWARNQPSLERFEDELRRAGFVNVWHSLEIYPCQIQLSRWQTMVMKRFWSTFSNFSDRELEEACQTIAESERDRIDKEGSLHFEDRLLFITAEK